MMKQTPGGVALPFTTLIAGLVDPVPVSFELHVPGLPLVAPTPLHVIVSFAVAPAWLYVPVITADAPTASEPGTPVRLAAGTSPQVMVVRFSLDRKSGV